MSGELHADPRNRAAGEDGARKSVHQPESLSIIAMLSPHSLKRALPLVRSVALLSLLPVAATGQVSRFQGVWFVSPSDSAEGRTIAVEGLRVRLRERCPRPDEGFCEFVAIATPYGPLAAAPSDTTVTTLVVEAQRGELYRLLILSLDEQPGLHATTFTRFPEGDIRGTIVERQRLHLGTTARPPPPTVPGSGPSAMPQFPWPPPTPTASLRLPDRVVGRLPGDSLGSVFDRLRTAMARVELGWWSVYAIGDSGFAIVTRMEAIEPDGRPKAPPNRWLTPHDRQEPRFTSIKDYLSALLTARPGHYRVIVLVVTDRVLTTSGVPLTADSATKLVSGGTDALPGWLRRRTVAPDGRCLALIYEFARPSESDEAVFVANSRATIVEHLSLAGLWTAGELRR